MKWKLVIDYCDWGVFIREEPDYEQNIEEEGESDE